MYCTFYFILEMYLYWKHLNLCWLCLSYFSGVCVIILLFAFNLCVVPTFRFIKDEPVKVEKALKKLKKLTSTLYTLKR